MPTHLLSLPLEIRYQIFGYLLISPSKYVTTLPPGPWLFSIMPWDLRQQMTLESHVSGRSLELSLLRVCKQLSEECKNILWGRNTVVYSPFEISRHNESVSQGRGPIALTRRVAMSVDMTAGGPDIWNVASALDKVGSWAQSGNLEELTIVIINERQKPFEERDPKVEHDKGYRASLERLLKVRTGKLPEPIPKMTRLEAPKEWKRCFEEHLLTLSEARTGSLANLKRKMIVNTNFGKLSAREQRKYLQEVSMDPNELMKELSVALGGELWIDGAVCFKDGEQIQNAFQLCHDEDHSDLPGEEERKPTTIPKYHEVSDEKENRGATGHGVLASAPWGQLLHERASVLDIVE